MAKALTDNEIQLENDVTTFIRYIEEEKRAKKAYDEVDRKLK